MHAANRLFARLHPTLTRHLAFIPIDNSNSLAFIDSEISAFIRTEGPRSNQE